LCNAIASLFEQRLHQRIYEIVIIDNNSTDDTHRIVTKNFVGNRNIKLVTEHRQGLSHARNRGWMEAKGEYVGYFDDDSIAPPQWLSEAKRIIEEYNPHIFGGPYYAYYDSEKPKWFKDEYGSFSRGEAPTYLNASGHLCGTNIFIKKDLFKIVGGFNPFLGMNGASFAYHEETEFMESARLTIPGIKIYYDPKLYVRHLVDKRKYSLLDRTKRGMAYGKSDFRRKEYRKVVKKVNPLAALTRLTIRSMQFLLSMTWGGILRDRTKFPYYENYYYEAAIKRLSSLGFEIKRTESAIVRVQNSLEKRRQSKMR
jgi:GT2 family glycosyltransferase